MSSTLRGFCYSLILFGIAVITVLLLEPLFGPQPLSNPVAGVFFFAVVISSCLLLYFRGFIINYFISRIQEKKPVALICPRYLILVDKESGIYSNVEINYNR